MNNFGTLYCYEVKKILSRKLTWTAFLVCFFCIALTATVDLIGKYYVDGEVADTHYHMFRVDQEYLRALSGRKLDQKLLEEMSAAYRKIPVSEERYTLTEEYQTYARPYSAVFQLVRLWTQQKGIDEIREWEPDEEALYAARAENLEKEWQALRLSDAEKAFWREKEARTEIPVTYLYHDGYRKIAIHGMNTIGILVLLSAFMACIVFTVYGAEGFHASLQLCAYMWASSHALTIGQACLIAYTVLILTAAFVSVMVMVLSEILHHNIATLAVCVGLIMAGIFVQVPYQYRVFAQIWDWLPLRFLNLQNIFDIRLFSVFGHCLVSWKVVPVLYVLAGAAAAFAGKIFYRNYQVSGR